MIAYPICPAYKVSGADITIRLQSGEKSTFKTLWSAKGATSSEVARGIFTVGAPDSFREGGTPLTKALPEGFYVGVDEISRDGHKSAKGDWIDQSVRPSSPLKAGEYLTSHGKIVSRKWVNDQLKCENAS
ncbi:hypothetical protein [Streptomyces sp. CEV 2-1]|uniref:hypothetical protein n=1 Tax=Streptomyces sp. CEV 2-1 TaxID=2485153 RepID=UPI0011CDDB7C|nr:hypothetical protein [Streptomyces sp. CEV 2-1]